MSKNANFSEYPNDGKCDITIVQQKKVTLSEHFKCSLDFKQNIVIFVPFCYEIIIKSPSNTHSGVSLVNKLRL